MAKNTQKHIDINLAEGGVLRIEPVTPYVFRIRLRPDDQFREPSLIRYGIVGNDWEPVDFVTGYTDDSTTLHTDGAALSINEKDGRLVLYDSQEEVILREAGPPRSAPESGFDATFELGEDEKLYGLGDETRDRIQKRGHRTQMWVRNVACYAPIPFLMSTGGWGIFLNTTWRHFFDMGHQQKDRLRFWSRAGELDYYLIAGETLPILLDRYTDIAGKPHLLPLQG